MPHFADNNKTSVFLGGYIDRSTWKSVKLGEFELHRNNTCSRSFMASDGGRIQNVHYGDILVKFDEIVSLEQTRVDYLTFEGENYAAKDFLQNGDIVIADTAEDETVGKMVEVQDVGNHKVVAGLHTIFYRPPPDLFARGWLGYWMNSTAYHDQLNQYMTGIKVLSLSKSSIANTIIQYPPKTEQQQIVTALESIQKHIASLQALITKYEAIKKATINLLLVPKDDWSCSTIGESFELSRGVVISKSTIDKHPGRYPVYSSQSTNDGVLGYINTYRYDGEYITWTTDGANAGTVFSRTDQFNCTNVCGIAKSRNDDILPSFVAMQVARYAKTFVSYVGNPKLMSNVFAQIPFSYPHKERQLKIVAQISTIDNVLKDCHAQLAKAKSLKQGIMSYFFG